MFTFRRRLAATAVLGAVVLAGCAVQPASGDSATEVPEAVDLKGAKVVSMFTSFNNDYFADWDRGARAAVEAFNGTYVAQTDEGDPARLVAQFEQAVEEGAKIIFVDPPGESAVPAIARIAEENDVCWANTWAMVPWETPFDYGDSFSSYLIPNMEQAAYDTAVALFEEMGGEGNLVHVTGALSVTDTQRTAGVDRALAEYPDIELVDRQAAVDWTRDTSRNTMAGIISRFGTDIDGVFGQNDDVAIGALNALSEAGVTGVPITGMDGNAGTIPLIQSGQIFAAYSTFPRWLAGYTFVQALDRCMSGEATDPLARQLWTGGLLVTEDNAQEYIDTYTGDADPYDWVKMSRVANPDDWDPQNEVRALDLEVEWAREPQPAGYVLPDAYAKATADMEAFNADLDERWQLLRR